MTLILSPSRPSHRELRQALLAPQSIALIGASDDDTKTSARPLRFLRRAGFEGAVYPINPRRSTVSGERTWPSVSALPSIPDHAFVLTPANQSVDAVEECGKLGVSVVTILASGFGEAGAEGAALEKRLRRIIDETGVRVLGPSSLGVINTHQRLVLTANAAFAEPDIPVGEIFVASHSGSLIGALVSRGKARGIGFAGLVSVGNEVDLSIGEICAATLDDSQVGSYLLFLETIRKGEALRRFALGAAERGKPVVAYKLGRSKAAAEIALSHTGALAGEDDVADAFLKDCGIARVYTLEALLECTPLLSSLPLPAVPRQRGRVGVVTTTGGGAAMVVDELGVRDIIVEGPTPQTLSRLASAGVEIRGGRIVDLTLAGTRYSVMKSALDVLLSAPEYDLIVAVAGSSARFEPDLAVRPIIDSAGHGKPLAAFIVPDAPAALSRLAEAGIASFRTPEACADAIAAAFSRRWPRPLPPSLSSPASNGSQTLDELEAYSLLERLGVPHARCAAVSAHAAAPFRLDLSYPVVAKVLSSDIAHKTDVGGVVLGVQDEAHLCQAIERIRSDVTRLRAGALVERVLVQEMVSGIGEVLIGYRRDAQAGPIVMVAAGGVLTEIYRDRALRLAPVDLPIAHEMISEVKALHAFAGYRGKEPGDMDALARAIVALSTLAVMTDLLVMEAEINPLIIGRVGEGVVAVDALVHLG
jgi:acetate---CoA ligase (ADP-forming)